MLSIYLSCLKHLIKEIINMICQSNIRGWLFFLLTLPIVVYGQQDTAKVSYQHPIPYQPQSYVCYRVSELLEIDGKLTETAWKNAEPTADFVDIEGDLKVKPPFQTNVKMLWDEDYFYFGAYLEEPHIWAKLTERDAVIFYDNDFEIFIDPDGDTHHYYEFEMNALNTVWDLLLLRPYREDGQPKVLDSWDIQGLQSAVYIDGTINNPTDTDRFWTVEVAIPWKVLEEMTPQNYLPKDGVQWRVNFSRVNWHMDYSSGNYEKKKAANGKRLPEENWVWSPQGYIAMHAPETWGFVQFSTIEVGQGRVDFNAIPDEKIKWALRQMYYQQRQYFQQHGQYADNLKYLTLPTVDIPNYTFKPELLMEYDGYTIIVTSTDSQYVWVLQEDGKVYQTINK